MNDLDERTETLARWILAANYLVIFSGAGISTESKIPDFRGKDGIWTRQEKGLPPPPKVDWSRVQPNQAHHAITTLQNIGKLKFLITQNIDNLHLKSGIKPELLAEFHGNITKLRCTTCENQVDAFPDLIDTDCPICQGGRLVSSIVNFGDSIPHKTYADSVRHSKKCDLFIVVGSSLVVYPAAEMPEIALKAEAKLIIINGEKTPFDNRCHLRFWNNTGTVLPLVVSKIDKLIST